MNYITNALAALLILLSFGLDQRVTLNLSPVSYLILALVVLTVGYLGGKSYANESKAQEGLLELSQMRRDAPGRWLTKGILSVGLSALLFAGATWYLLSVLVSYVPGDSDRLVGVVERLYSVTSRGRLCNVYAVVLLESDVRTKFCYERGLFESHRISSEPLRKGDRVIIVISRTPIGSAVQSVARETP